MTSGSYDPHRTVGAGIDDESARLEAQAALTAHAEIAVMERVGVPGPLLVEVGCGSGAFLTRLAARFPDHDVRGVEIRPDLLGRARARGCRVLPGDACALPLHTATCGTVVLRFVLQHLQDPQTAVREAARVLEPGGRLVVIDVDVGIWGCVTPTFGELTEVYARFAAAQARQGGDRLIGRKASRWLRAAGLSEVRTEVYSVSTDDRPIDDFEIHAGPSRLAPLIASGDLGMADLARATHSWQTLRADPDAWIMLLGVVATGVKPPATTHSAREGRTPP